jgi:hypothetical protein
VGINVQEKFGNQFQELFKVHKIRNKYFIEGVVPPDPSHDIDDFYLEAGEPTLPPCEMKERMYNVVRFLKMQNSMAVQEYQLKKNDIIKMGRVKLKIKLIHYSDKVKLRNMRLVRRKKRLQNERAVYDEEEKKEEVPPKSKYPENYENISLGSDRSIYQPIVGEINYVQAVLPPQP